MKAKRILASVLSVALLLQLSPLNIWALDENPQQTPQVSTVQENLDPAPTAEPIPEETAAPTPEPTAEPTAAPAAEESAPDAAETPAPEPTAEPTATPDPAAEVQAMIDALPDKVTDDNAAAVAQALTDIDDAKESLTDEQLAGLDFARYDAAANALSALWGEAATDEVELLDDGTAPSQDPTDNYYQIDSVEDLCWLASASKYVKAKLTADIKLNGDNKVLNDDGSLTSNADTLVKWTPIGVSSDYPFKGTFDGNGHTISGLYFDNSKQSYVGLFGCVGKGGIVKNVNVTDSYMSGKWNVGGICGTNSGGTVRGCTSGCTVTGVSSTGGICGSNEEKGSVLNCHNTGKVTGTDFYIGGVCGYNEYGILQESDNTGAVTGASQVGGVCGFNQTQGTVKGCYNTGEVSGKGNVGGVCGFNKGILQESYNIGEVSGNDFVGGVCAQNQGNVNGCYNIGEVTGKSNVGGVCGGGYASNCYYLDTSAETSKGGTAKTAAEFRSGMVAYELQEGLANQVWGQLLTGEGKQDHPVLSSDSKYKVHKAAAESQCPGYSNTSEDKFDHEYDENGVCIHCCGWQPAKEVKAETGNYYEISNQGQLRWFADQVNNNKITIHNARLAKNITMDSTAWTPIGTSYDLPFQGTFNGNSFTISGLKCADTSADYVGLFGCVGEGGIVENVNVTDSYMSGSFYVGGICGYNKSGAVVNCTSGCTVTGTIDSTGGICGYNEEKGSVLNCHNTGKVTGTRDYTGGVCGFNKGILQESYNIGEVSGYKYVGGVCGQSYGTVNGCYNTGEVLGEGNVGGVCGSNESSGTVNRCYNTGKVSGYNYVGGVCGYNDFSGTVNGCYNTGEVDGDEFVGGVCGWNGDYGTVQNSYNIGTVSGDNNVGNVGGVCGGGSNSTDCYYLSDTSGTDSNGGIPKTKAEFQSGEVAFLLQSKCAEATWGQTLTEPGKQNYPVLGGDKVYQTTPCPAGYSNQEGTHKDHPAIDANGQCTACGTQCIAYTVTIPATVALGNEKTQTADITAQDITLPADKTLKVTVNGPFTATLDGATDVSVDYTIEKDGNALINNATVLPADSGEASKTTTLTFVKPDAAPYAGSYTGTVTFTVGVN